MQDFSLALRSERTESFYNSVELAADLTEQSTRPAVLMAEQMAPCVRAIALASEQMAPYVRTAALATEQLTPYVRAAALTAKSAEPFLRIIAQATAHIEAAFNSQSWQTIVQKGAGLNQRIASTTSEMAKTKQGQFVRNHEFLEAPLFLPSSSDPQNYDTSSRSVVTDQVLQIGPRESLVCGMETLEYRLTHLSPELPRMLIGARAALKTPNPDRARHVIVSLRELVTHVLHRLAPDECLRNWIDDESLLDDGRPTREARLRYIYREISSGILSKPIKYHLKWGIALIRILNRETHVVSSQLTDAELLALYSATESLLYFVL